MKVFLKNYNIGRLLPPEVERIPVRNRVERFPPAGGNAMLENQTQKTADRHNKRPPGAARRPHQSSPIFMFSRFFQNPVFRNSYRIS